MFNFFKKHKKLSFFLTFLGVLTIIAVVLNEQSSLKYSPPLPSPDNTTPTKAPSPTNIPSLHTSPKSVFWSDLKKTDPDTVAISSYSYSPTQLTINNLRPLAQSLNFKSQPENTQTQYMSIIVWSSNDFHLSANQKDQAVDFSFNDPQLIKVKGDFLSPDTLTGQLSSLITNSQLFDPQVKFKLLSYAYLSSSEEWFTLTDQDQADVITLNLIPLIDKYPIFTQELQFITAFYNRQNQLVKLSIKKPFSSVVVDKTVKLITSQQLKQLPPEYFFRLYINPQTQSDFFYKPSDIDSLYPSSVNLGYFFSDNTLQPIFILSQNDNYYYAAFASSP